MGLFGASDTIPAPKALRMGEVDGVVLRRLTYTYPHAVSDGNRQDVRDAVEQTFRWEIVKEADPDAVTFRVWAAPATTPTIRAKLIRLIEGGVLKAGAAVDAAQAFSESVNPFDLLINKLGLTPLKAGLLLLVVAVLLLVLLAWAVPRITGG